MMHSDPLAGLKTMFRFSRRASCEPHRPAGDGLVVSLEKMLDGVDGPLHLRVEFTLEPGQWLAVQGASGAGKTTLLRLLAGLAPAARGYIRSNGRIWLDSTRGVVLPVRKRRIGFVFQDYALFPHMSVRRQLAFAQPRRDRRRQDALLAFAGLEGLADALPGRLSGGQQQRLALIRALASEPDYLFLDEPLSALDTTLRRDLQTRLAGLRDGALGGRPPGLILVTHDPGEALRLADRVFLMERGRIVRDTTPAALFGLDTGENGLILNGRILGRETDGAGEAPCYRVAAEGQVCRVPVADAPDLQPGEAVFLRAGALRLRAARLQGTEATQPEEHAQGQQPE